MLRSETSVYPANSVINSAVRVFGSSGFFIVKLVSLVMSNLGFIRLPDCVHFHWQRFSTISFRLFGSVSFLRKVEFFVLSGICLVSVLVSNDLFGDCESFGCG